MNQSLFVILSAGLLAGQGLAAKSKLPSLQGVWQAVEVTTTGPGARTVAIPQPRPNLTIFTARHYSQLHVDAEGPRPMLADPTTASAEQLRAAWGPFSGEAGTYAVTDGHSITVRPIVAKNAAAMASGSFVTYSFRLEGDVLWITLQKNQNGPIVNPPTIKAVRVE